METTLPVHIDVIPLDQVHENHFTRSIHQNGRVVFECKPGGEAETLRADELKEEIAGEFEHMALIVQEPPLTIYSSLEYI